MYPAVGVLGISSYALFIWVALGCMSVGLYKWNRSYGIGLLAVALFGARFMHIFTNWSVYREHPALMYSLDLHGLSIFGSMIFVGLCIVVVGYIRRVPLWKKMDGLVPYAGASIVLARIGCFLGGCCFGIVTKMPWGVRFPLFSDAHMFQLANSQSNLLVSKSVHPTQLYEIIGVCFSTFVAIKLRHTKRFMAGDTLVTFIGIYFFTRLIVHFFRVYPESFSTAYMFPFFYGGIVLYYLIYGVLSCKKRRKNG